jgi:hypothetical protein
MEPDGVVAALAWSAAKAVVDAMSTDGWQRVKRGLVGLWQRRLPDQAGMVDAQLEDTRTRMLAGDQLAPDELRQQWGGHITELLRADPDASRELAAILSGAAVVFGSTSHTGSGSIHQSVGDMTVHHHG